MRSTTLRRRPWIGPPVLVAALLLATALGGPATSAAPAPRASSFAGVGDRLGANPDPVLRAIELNQARTPPGVSGTAEIAVLGRADVFADNLAATALAGTRGPVLFTDGGPQASLRQEVLTELERTLRPGSCTDATGPTVFLAGGVNALSQTVEDTLRSERFCVTRLSGPTRVETAVAIADAITAPSDTVLLARADTFADAASIGSYAAATGSRILVTPPDGLHPAAAAALDGIDPAEIVLLGGTVALTDDVMADAAQYAPVRRVAGPTRDATAVAFAEELWTDAGPAARGDGVALANGYEASDWTHLFAGAAYAAERHLPFLYTNNGEHTPATRTYLADNPSIEVTLIGPGRTASTADLDAAAISLETVTVATEPLMIKPRPGSAELWIIERRGTITALTPDGERRVLDISDTVSTTGERGLLGLAFNPDGTQLFTSSTDNAGNSVIDVFAILDGVADAASRQEILQVDQPASNHNGGDLVWGPDNHLYWSLGDGGASNDRFGNGQNTATLLGGIVRIDVTDSNSYAVPADNPFVAGGGAPELWAYGLRNPFRIAFDPDTADLYIGDVGQGAVEEINHVPAGTGGGRNYGWPVFEGDRPFTGGSLPDHTPPVLVETHSEGNCSITGGVVYRGEALPELDGAYLYSDYCRSSIRALVIEDGALTQRADLGVRPTGGAPVGFGVDHSGEVYVLSQNGAVQKVVPA